jgi:hypothetical protein
MPLTYESGLVREAWFDQRFAGFEPPTPIVVDLTPAAETDAAQALVVTKPIVKSLTPATETDAAQALSITTGGGGGPATPTLVNQTAVEFASASSYVVNFPAVTTGNLLTILVSTAGGPTRDITAVADNGSPQGTVANATYAISGKGGETGATNTHAELVAGYPTGGPTQATITLDGAGVGRLIVAEWSGVTGAMRSSVAGGNPAATTHQTDATTPAAGDLVIAHMTHGPTSGSNTPSAYTGGFTNLTDTSPDTSGPHIRAAYKIASGSAEQYGITIASSGLGFVVAAFEPSAAGGTIYQKTGVAAADTVALGADVYEAVESGTALADTVATAADIYEAVEAGTAAAVTTATGADAATVNRAGTGSSAARATGADVFEAARQNTATADTVAAAADVYEAVEAGTAAADTLATGADAATINRVGAASSAAKLTGADVFEAVESGTGKAGTTAGGTSAEATDAVTYEKTGVGVAGSRAAAADIFEATEAGTGVATSRTAAPRVVDYTETGAGTTQATGTGADVFQATEAGTATTQARARGSVQAGFIAKFGTATSRALASAADAFTGNRAGTSTTAARAAGADTFEATETGKATAGSRATGADTTEYTETGTTTAGSKATGGDQSTLSRVGTALAGLFARAADIFTADRTGTGTTRATATGGSEFVPAPITYEKSGAAAAGTRARASRELGSILPTGVIEGTDHATGVEGVSYASGVEAVTAGTGVEGTTTGVGLIE